MRWQFPVSSGLGQTSLVGHHFRHGIIGSHGTEPLSGPSCDCGQVVAIRAQSQVSELDDRAIEDHHPKPLDQSEDRRRLRRLHGDGKLRALVDSNARALHASDRCAEDRTLKVSRKKVAGAVHLRCFAASVDNLRVKDGSPTEAPSPVRGAKVGGRQEARTPDLRVANAALSQLS
jgi:hypothetical protein